MIEQRGIGMCIFLTIVTCGIYGIYWYYCILDDLYKVNGQPSNAGTDVLLSIVTCGIYSVYMMYKIGNMVSSARMGYGLPDKNDSILFLIISLFGLSIVVYCIVQSELNDTLGPVYNNYISNNMYSGNSGYGGPVYPQDNFNGQQYNQPQDPYNNQYQQGGYNQNYQDDNNNGNTPEL